jgi:hypothetical protein
MLPFDSYVQKRVGNRQRRSEAERRLYWSTYQKMACRAPAPRRKSQVWMDMRRLLSALRRGWHERAPSDMRVGDEVPRTQPLISEEGKV